MDLAMLPCTGLQSPAASWSPGKQPTLLLLKATKQDVKLMGDHMVMIKICCFF